MVKVIKTILAVSFIFYAVSLFVYSGLSFVQLEWIEWNWYAFRTILFAGFALGLFGSFIKWLIKRGDDDE